MLVRVEQVYVRASLLRIWWRSWVALVLGSVLIHSSRAIGGSVTPLAVAAVSEAGVFSPGLILLFMNRFICWITRRWDSDILKLFVSHLNERRGHITDYGCNRTRYLSRTRTRLPNGIERTAGFVHQRFVIVGSTSIMRERENHRLIEWFCDFGRMDASLSPATVHQCLIIVHEHIRRHNA